MSAPVRLQSVATAFARFSTLITQAEALGQDLRPEEIPDALGQLERARARLFFRGTSVSGPLEDRLLNVTEAAELLDMAPDSLYRRSSSLPFTVRDGRRVRFSRAGIDRFIRARQGRS